MSDPVLVRIPLPASLYVVGRLGKVIGETFPGSVVVTDGPHFEPGHMTIQIREAVS